MTIRSLLLVEEKLLESEYFALTLRRLRPPEIYFHLNAFLSSARSVTFLIQKELSGVLGFGEYWEDRQAVMRSDLCMKFFVTARNISQKSGKVELQGVGRSTAQTGLEWRYSLSGSPLDVPDELTHREVSNACLNHTSKLASEILMAMERFPFDTCPTRACCPDGARHLGLTITDFVTAAGFPPAWIEAMPEGELDEVDAFRVLKRYFDAVDVGAIKRVRDNEKR